MQYRYGATFGGVGDLYDKLINHKHTDEHSKISDVFLLHLCSTYYFLKHCHKDQIHYYSVMSMQPNIRNIHHY